MRGPEQADSLLRVDNSLITILNARNAIITADARNSIKTMLNRKSPDRYKIYFRHGSSVQIAMNQSWIGTYRVVSVLDRNLILDRASRLFKWPKCKTRTIRDVGTGRFGATVIPQSGAKSIGDSLQETPTEIADQSLGSPNDNEVLAGVAPPDITPIKSMRDFQMEDEASAIQFLHPGSDFAYGLLAPSDNYRHILPVNSVDIHGVVT